MNDYESVTKWIVRLREGCEENAQLIVELFFDRLVGLARVKLGSFPKRVADEEDVAIESLQSFLRGMREGRFLDLNDRHDLWQVLAMLTERKAVDQLRRLAALFRGGGSVGGESAFEKSGGYKSSQRGIAQVIGVEPTPEFIEESFEQMRLLLDSLEDVQLEEVALLKLAGLTNAEISEQQNVTPRTIERRLRLIREIWEDKLPSKSDE